ncbi:response regulator [Aggregatilinea lenta]|uniref:response regulator n=1 Tax=Aggregatilinea lenta TaxID=913108 RepID=UPI000E5B8A75|nr:response regulator [Aggregatilinea lenta]
MVHRILVVEDNPDNRILITDILETLGYITLVAEDGESGLTMAQTERPDLILMDLSLPKLDGWAVAKQLKDEDGMAHIPIIALTAHAMVGDRELALRAGCDDYVAKPINLHELESKLAHFLS